jgi:hypothetical protein
VFNAAAEFVVPIISGGKKRTVVRFPTDAEWCERTRRTKRLREQLGGGKTRFQGDLNWAEVSFDLFKKVNIGPCEIVTEVIPEHVDSATGALVPKVEVWGPCEDFDQAEAVNVLGRISRWDMTRISRNGDGYRIEAKVAGARVAYILRIPTQKESQTYWKEVRPPGIQTGTNESVRIFLEPCGELFDKVAKSTEGYEGSAPIVHKDMAVTELLNEVNRLAEQLDDDPEV